MTTETAVRVRDVELWAATRTLAMHGYGRCAQCPPKGSQEQCRMRVWAAAIRAQAERQGLQVPPVPVERPDWPAVPPPGPA